MKEKEVPFILDNYQYKTLENAIKAKNTLIIPTKEVILQRLSILLMNLNKN